MGMAAGRQPQSGSTSKSFLAEEFDSMRLEFLPPAPSQKLQRADDVTRSSLSLCSVVNDPRQPVKAFFSLAPAETKPESGTEVDPQRGVSDYFFVVLIQRIFDVQVAGHVGVDLVPASEVDASISRRMLDAQT
jgi:hypothetical protein